MPPQTALGRILVPRRFASPPIGGLLVFSTFELGTHRGNSKTRDLNFVSEPHILGKSIFEAKPRKTLVFDLAIGHVYE